MTCATKSLILHLEWREEVPECPKSPVSSPTTSSGPRTPTTLTPPAPRNRVVSLKAGIPLRRPSGMGRGGLQRTPSTPVSLQSPRVGTPQLLLPKKAPIVTAPPKIVAVVETPDLAVGAVDPRKRRVITATRFSSRTGADRRVSTRAWSVQFVF
jgi:pyrimidine and pyridine-specific 5'-nucleotidase